MCCTTVRYSSAHTTTMPTKSAETNRLPVSARLALSPHSTCRRLAFGEIALRANSFKHSNQKVNSSRIGSKSCRSFIVHVTGFGACFSGAASTSASQPLRRCSSTSSSVSGSKDPRSSVELPSSATSCTATAKAASPALLEFSRFIRLRSAFAEIACAAEFLMDSSQAAILSWVRSTFRRNFICRVTGRGAYFSGAAATSASHALRRPSRTFPSSGWSFVASDNFDCSIVGILYVFFKGPRFLCDVRGNGMPESLKIGISTQP